MSYNIILDMYVKIFFVILQLVLYTQYCFASAEPLTGPGIRRVRGNEFPFVVSIGIISVRDAELNHVCTGSLISRRHVLTALHCLTYNLGEFEVSIGSNDLRSAQKYQVSWWITYDDWRELRGLPMDNRVSDIAIIKLSTRVNDPRIDPAELSPLNRFTAVGLSLNMAGWGKDEQNVTPRYLRTARTSVISGMQCSEILSTIERMNIILASNYMCTQEYVPVFVTCGDSGGPLFTNDHKIVGINKSSCLDYLDDEDRVGIHLSIDDYRVFIRDVIQSEN